MGVDVAVTWLRIRQVIGVHLHTPQALEYSWFSPCGQVVACMSSLYTCKQGSAEMMKAAASFAHQKTDEYNGTQQLHNCASPGPLLELPVAPQQSLRGDNP